MNIYLVHCYLGDDHEAFIVHAESERYALILAAHRKKSDSVRYVKILQLNAGEEIFERKQQNNSTEGHGNELHGYKFGEEIIRFGRQDTI